MKKRIPRASRIVRKEHERELDKIVLKIMKAGEYAQLAAAYAGDGACLAAGDRAFRARSTLLSCVRRLNLVIEWEAAHD